MSDCDSSTSDYSPEALYSRKTLHASASAIINQLVLTYCMIGEKPVVVFGEEAKEKIIELIELLEDGNPSPEEEPATPPVKLDNLPMPVNHHTHIDILPNEILTKIFKKCMKEMILSDLIMLRIVCSRWKDVIKAMLNQEQNLFLALGYHLGLFNHRHSMD